MNCSLLNNTRLSLVWSVYETLQLDQSFLYNIVHQFMQGEGILMFASVERTTECNHFKPPVTSGSVKYGVQVRSG